MRITVSLPRVITVDGRLLIAEVAPSIRQSSPASSGMSLKSVEDIEVIVFWFSELKGPSFPVERGCE